jgi:Pretoxin HINT domain
MCASPCTKTSSHGTCVPPTACGPVILGQLSNAKAGPGSHLSRKAALKRVVPRGGRVPVARVLDMVRGSDLAGEGRAARIPFAELAEGDRRIPLEELGQEVRGKYCFVAGTPLLTPGGAKAIEQFRVGDLILSRAEDDRDGAVEVKVVEATFVRVSPVLEVRVGGRVIGTTGEHRFYVRGKGWRCARELEPGDELSSHDGRWVAVGG